MSVKVSELCWGIPLPIAEKLVLLRLANYANDSGGSIYPAVRTVAHFCGISPRAVQYILKKLMADGLLLVVENEKGGRGRTRHYAIDLDRAGQLAGPEGGQANGTGKRVQDDCTLSEPETVQRAQDHCTLSDGETLQRVQNPVIKGEVDLPRIHQEESKVGGGYAHAHACEVRTMVAGLTGLPANEPNLATVKDWLAAKYDPVQDIYPAVVKALPTAKGEIGSFRYFTKAVGREHSARTIPVSESGSNVHHIRSDRSSGTSGQDRPSARRAAWRDQSCAYVANLLDDDDPDADDSWIRMR